MSENNGTYKVGEDLLLTCTVGGDDENVVISWEKDQLPLPNDGHYHTTDGGELYVAGVVKRDEGNYACRAAREDSSLVMETTIIIQGKFFNPYNEMK